jgi:hypothetical protein
MAVLFIGVLVSYFGGVKGGRAWGTPLLMLCVLGLVVAVVLRATGVRRASGSGSAERMRGSEPYEAAKLIGEGLKGGLERGARILVFVSNYDAYPKDPQTYVKTKEDWQRGLAEGLGDDTIQIVGYVIPAEDTSLSYSGFADYFAMRLRNYPDVAAMVSFTGLPPDIDRMGGYELGTRLKVGAYFSTFISGVPLREWLGKNYVQAAVVKEGRSLKLYTPQALPASGAK